MLLRCGDPIGGSGQVLVLPPKNLSSRDGLHCTLNCGGCYGHGQHRNSPLMSVST